MKKNQTNRYHDSPVFVLSTILTISTLIVIQPRYAYSFDDDLSINDIRLKDESFLDINAHQFRRSLDLHWLDTLNGWRATGGSVSSDRLYLKNEFKLHNSFSKILDMGIEFEQENFYARKPAPLPLVYIDVYPVNTSDIGFSLMGTPAYDKRQSDLGYAITFGRRPTNFSRLSWLKIDKYYNEKNEFDDSYYEKFGETLRLQGRYQFRQGWDIFYDLKNDTPLTFVSDNQTSLFEHQSYDYTVKLVHHTSARIITGANLRLMTGDRALQETGFSQEQSLAYESLDIYQINNLPGINRELTLGFRYDNFREELRDFIDITESYDFELTTSQVYASINHTYSLHQAWDLGLYIGWSERSRKFLLNSTDSFDDSGIQAKLRTSWQYRSSDKNSVLLITMTFNLDDLVDDPGDGGGMYIQTRF